MTSLALTLLSLSMGTSTPVLPTVLRPSPAFTASKLYWTNSATAERGTIVVRGADAPVNGSTYSVGAPIGTSKVVCVDTIGTASASRSCTEGSVPTVSQIDSYRFYHYDAAKVYSLAVTVANVPAYQTTGFTYNHLGTSLTPPGIFPSALGTPFVVFGGTDNGLFFINPQSGGSEHRRAYLATNSFDSVRRSTPYPMSDGSGTFAMTVDSQNNFYKVSATSSTVSTFVGPGKVTSGVMSFLLNYIPASVSWRPHSTYSVGSGDIFMYGTNRNSNNKVACLDSGFVQRCAHDFNLTVAEWSKDQIETEMNMDYYHGYAFAPVTGTGCTAAEIALGGCRGLYAYDLTTAPVASIPPIPSGWSARKILMTEKIRAQCRVTNYGAWMYCGTDGGTVYAINPLTGATLASVTPAGIGSIKAIFPTAPGGATLYYTTRTGYVGRLNFDGTTLTDVWKVQPAGGTTTGNAVASLNYVWAGANGRLYKLNPADGTTSSTVMLDGGIWFVSEIGTDGLGTTPYVYVSTSAGTIWVLPQ